MPTSIEVRYSVSVNASCAWKIDAKDILTIDGNNYVNVDPNGSSFVRMVLHGSDAVPVKKTGWRPTLANVAAYAANMELRNAAVAVLNNSEQPNGDPLQGLFGIEDGSPKAAKRSPPKLNATQLKEMRAAKQSMEFELPGVNGNPSLSVSCAVPAHPRDHIILRLDPDTVEHVVMFLMYIQSIENCTDRRGYGEFEAGVWRNGSGKVVRKLEDDSARKFKRMRKTEAASEVGCDQTLEDGDAAPEPDSPVRALSDLA